MPIDPARLARIRARVLAAAAVAVPASAGCGPTHVNERPTEYVNLSAPDDRPPKPVDGPINERVVDPPPTAPTPPDEPNINRPEPKHINTPEPKHINTPAPDTAKAPAPKDIPPPGQTINVVKADTSGPPPHINTAAPMPPNPPPAPKK